ncbi:hypothetical protein [Crateriforma conspicua]|uniref:Uncharacterized protein n=1 Tax=Crateriforma conspicua TaxID=2527996 RepID=A0A5C5Y4S8_9PLAN|nr:hypothetical protein [Crateriforma conspicua]QDV65242.1 hypothetical protein Mal65_44120 [Crateriforma conspicua]TWT70637.1 hypothetical protein Pan14r_29440 [Crateriforma conspicua]
MDIHLYLMCYRHEALVASHLSAEEFGAYMAVGTRKKTFGNVVFFELDPSFRSSELNLEQLEERCVPHSSGQPRRSKYMSVYRVMEHVPLEAYGQLHLTTRDGRVLSLDSQDYQAPASRSEAFMYAELCPLTPRIVTKLDPLEFTKKITDSANPVSVPRIFFAETQVARDSDGRLAGYLPYNNPAHIEDCLDEITNKPAKFAKTVDRDPPLTAFYRTIASGFYVGDSTGIKQYAYPSVDELEEKHHKWWRSATMG